MTKRKTKRKSNRKPAKSIKRKTKPNAKAGSFDSILGEKYFTYNGQRYVITNVETITEGQDFTDYDGSSHFLPTFKKVFLQGIREVAKKEYL